MSMEFLDGAEATYSYWNKTNINLVQKYPFGELELIEGELGNTYYWFKVEGKNIHDLNGKVNNTRRKGYIEENYPEMLL